MKTTTKEVFKIIGIKLRTTNENQQGAKDIGELWHKFMSENIKDKIPNKLNESTIAAYTNYESDYTKAYDTVLGCFVSSLNDIPKGMIGLEFKKGSYKKFISQGDLTKGIVYKTWTEIWSTELDRSYVVDFEIYGEKSKDIMNAEVEIFVGVK